MAAAAALASASLLAPVATASAAATTSASVSVAPDGQDPHLMAGQVIGAGDQAVDGAELVVHVANTTDTGTDLTPIAEGVTDDTGSFELHGALGEAPYSLNPDGSVQLEIMVTDPAADTIRFVLLNALPPAENRPDWTFNQTPDPAVLPEPAAAQASERAYGVIRGLSLPMTGDGSVEYNASANDAVGASPDETSEALAEDNTQPYSDDGVPAHSGVGDGAVADVSASVLADSGTQDDVGDCKSYNGSMNWVDLSSEYDVMRRVPLHLSETKDRTYNQFDWSTTTQSQMQVAYNGKYNGVPYSGGMSYSRNNVSSTGVSAVAFKEAYRINMLRMGWKFRKQYLLCSVYTGRSGFQFDTGERRYVPHHWTTDNVNREVSTTFTCQAENRVRWDNDVWVSRSTSKTFAGYFSIFGVTLDSKQTRGTDHKIWYKRKNVSISAMGCGKGADPSYAPWVREYQM